MKTQNQDTTRKEGDSRMKCIKLLVIMAAVMITLGFGGTALAFHGGGVAHCDGCHTMHNSPDNPAEGVTNGTLMLGTDATSTCLNCHAGAGSGSSYHSLSENASVLSPGGDFFWLTKDYQVNLGWTVRDYPGQNTGHNVIAEDFGLGVDTANATAPGGTYSSAKLGCTSCHDAHGQVLGGTSNNQLPVEDTGSYGGAPADEATAVVGNYRLLGDSQFAAGNPLTDGYSFGNDAPIAAADPERSGRFSETDASHVDYGSGMSEWCENCHTGYLDSDVKHPAGDSVHLVGFATNYNSYVATGDFTGSSATSYLALVPFERGETDRTLLNPTSTQGPDSSSNVMCVTCHRAHASAFPNALRWDTATEFLAHSTPTTAEVPEMTDDTVPYYGRDIGTYFNEFQRSLCNKCHVRD